MAKWYKWNRKDSKQSVNASEEVRSELPIMGSPYQPVNPYTLEGTNSGAVGLDRAMGLAGVYRAVTVLATSVSQLDLGVFRNGVDVPQNSTSLIVRPDYTQPRTAFLEQTVTSLATNGNAYWLLAKESPTAAVKNVTVLNPLNISIETRDGKTFFNYGDKRYADWQIKHLKLTRLPGYTYGIGPIQACQNELRGALDLRNYADNWFREGNTPTVILKTDKALQPEMHAQYSQAWSDGIVNGTVTLGNGLSAERWAINPADAQWLESQQFSTTQIARMFGLPAQYLMTDPGNSSTYSNQQDVDSNFVRFTLMRYLTEIEDALSDLIPRGQNVKFNLDGLLRANTTQRYQAYQVALNAGFMTIDEVRELEGLSPMSGGTNTANPNQDDTESDQ